jgi:hypothetical protein
MRAIQSLNCRWAARSPALNAGEVAVAVNLRLPEALFKRPQLSACITVPEGAAPAPVINAEVVDNIRQVMQQQLGIDMTISVVENEEE